MSILKTSTLALALTAALGLSAAASAASVNNGTTNTLPTKVANVDVKDNTTVVTVPGTVNLAIDTTDLIIGRTTGFSVRVDLQNGATFGAAAPVPAIGPALPNSSGGTGPWTVSIAAGGASGDNYVVYSVQPGSTSLGVTSGTALSFTGLKFSNVGGLATTGSNAAAKFTFADPNTAQQILTPVTQNLLTSADPLKFSVSNPAHPNAKIDVGSQVVSSKTAFSNDGSLNNATPSYAFDTGTVSIGVNSGIYDASGATFTWATTDTTNLTVTGTFSAFTQTGASVKLVTAGTCASPSTTVAATSTTGSQVTFSGVAYSSLSSTGTGILCFTLPSANSQVIDATSVGVAATETRTATGKSSSASANGLAMAYNGPVAKVYTFNPASNTSMQSFLRITNTGSNAGKVTITGTDDTGTAGGTVSFTLGAGKSIQLTAQDLENGNSAKGLTGSLGMGTGKWRLTVTGEIAGMEVTNLNRSQTTNQVINLGTPVSGDYK